MDLVVRIRGGIPYEEKLARRKGVVKCMFVCCYSLSLVSDDWKILNDIVDGEVNKNDTENRHEDILARWEGHASYHQYEAWQCGAFCDASLGISLSSVLDM